MESQPKLGLLPQRRPWDYLVDCDSSDSLRQALKLKVGANQSPLLGDVLRAVLKQRLNLLLKSVLLHHTSVRDGNLTVTVDQQCHR